MAATELISGRTCWFQEGSRAAPWTLFHSVGILDHIQNEHLVASCSVPVFLPPVRIGNRYFLDGSISLERPLSAAVSMQDDAVPATMGVAQKIQRSVEEQSLDIT